MTTFSGEFVSETDDEITRVDLSRVRGARLDDEYGLYSTITISVPADAVVREYKPTPAEAARRDKIRFIVKDSAYFMAWPEPIDIVTDRIMRALEEAS